MKTVMTLFAMVVGLSAFADVTYEWKMTTDPLLDPTTETPMGGITAYLVDADVVNQQQVLTAVIGNGTSIDAYMASIGSANLASAVTASSGYIPETKFDVASSGTSGNAFFAAYSESLQALYFSGYSSITPDGFGTPTLVSNAYSSQNPIKFTTTFQGSMTDGAGGGWYAAVPEPTGGVLLVFGLALLGLKRKKG